MLITPQLRHSFLAVPDDTSNEDMDKVFEHFKSHIAQQDFNGSFPRVDSPSEMNGYELFIFYYSDFVSDAKVHHGGYIKEGIRKRRVYILQPRHTFGVFRFRGYTTDNAGEHENFSENGRDGSLPEGCAAAIDIALLYDYDLYHEDRRKFYGADSEEAGIVYRYGATDVTEADFKAVFVMTKACYDRICVKHCCRLPVFGNSTRIASQPNMISNSNFTATTPTKALTSICMMRLIFLKACRPVFPSLSAPR